MPALAQTTSPDGGSGNLTSQSSDTVSPDTMVSYGYVGLDDFYASSNWQHEMQILTGVYMGLSDRMEAGVGLSLANNSATLASGSAVRYFRAHGKYRYYGSRSEGHAASVFLYSTTGEVPDKPSLASGSTNNGFQLTYTTYVPKSEINYTLAMDTRDYKVYSGGSFSYALTPVLDLSASRMFYTKLDRIYELGLKAESATVNNSSSGNLYLVMAAHFDTHEALKYSAGTMLDIPGGLGVMKARYFVGFTYQTKTPATKRPSDTTMSSQTIKPMPVKEAPKPMAQAEGKLAAQAQAPMITTRPCLARVEVMDMSGVNGLGEKVTERLRKQGYCVSAVYTETNSMSFYSQLYYASDQEDAAKKLTKEFDIKGQVSERALPTNVDVRFIVGRDQQ